MPESSSAVPRSLNFYFSLAVATLISILGLGGALIDQWKRIQAHISDPTTWIQKFRFTIQSEPQSLVLLSIAAVLLYFGFPLVLHRLARTSHALQIPWTMDRLTLFAFFMFWFAGFLVISLGMATLYKTRSVGNAAVSLVLLPYVFQMTWGLWVLLRLEGLSWSAFLQRFTFRLDKGDGRKILQMFGLALVTMSIYSAVTSPLLKDVQTQEKLREIILQGRSWKQWLPSALALTILAPIYEEIIFRGVFLTWLRSRVSIPWAVLISGTVFGLFHTELLTLPALTLLGCVLAWSYLISQSILVPIAVHALWNLTALLSQFVNS